MVENETTEWRVVEVLLVTVIVVGILLVFVESTAHSYTVYTDVLQPYYLPEVVETSYPSSYPTVN